ncbi:MAG: carboxypeptidase-like regulatory domain-containing protein, partial [Bacteroidales bacterium]|nr:carboxypeptidase-like regulatory domain-containing protein [Bacteroidales bacterium]
MKKQLFFKAFIAVLAMVCGLSCLTPASAQNRAISGTVVDSQGEPIIGASVMVVGNSRVGTVTNADGTFSLSVPNGATMSVSCIGYATETFVVGTQQTYNIILQDDAEFLDETVVIGYGVQRKSDVTGAIASVKESDLANRTTTNAITAMQGKAAGVQIVNSSGAPGATSNIQIRGYSSNSKTSPLMIVDGLKVRSIDYLDPENI